MHTLFEYASFFIFSKFHIEFGKEQYQNFNGWFRYNETKKIPV